MRCQWGYVAPQGLLQEGGESCPQWRDRTCSADHCCASVDDDLVAGVRVGVARDVRYAASGLMPGVRRDGIDGLLERRHGEHAADPAAGRAITGVIPDRLTGDDPASGPQRRATATD